MHKKSYKHSNIYNTVILCKIFYASVVRSLWFLLHYVLFLQNHDPFMYRFCLSSVMLAQLPGRLFSPSVKQKKINHPFWLWFEWTAFASQILFCWSMNLIARYGAYKVSIIQFKVLFLKKLEIYFSELTSVTVPAPL